ncbi:MAG: hypothetical protein GOV15_01395 [Candidatus Diapherotrites archaeon]|nr:hypothetical protein [Candidatus Diapherotrites archaeon]
MPKIDRAVIKEGLKRNPERLTTFVNKCRDHRSAYDKFRKVKSDLTFEEHDIEVKDMAAQRITMEGTGEPIHLVGKKHRADLERKQKQSREDAQDLLLNQTFLSHYLKDRLGVSLEARVESMLLDRIATSSEISEASVVDMLLEHIDLHNAKFDE